jgi:hypothetical protein
MPKRTRKRIRVVIGGVDTHGRTHHAAVIDQQGRLLADREFPADSGGYRQLLGWLGLWVPEIQTQVLSCEFAMRVSWPR